MSPLGARSQAAELMDSEPVGFAEFSHCLRDLERLNHWSLAGRPTLSWLSRIAPEKSPITILDVGSGRGDMLRRIWGWAARAGKEVVLTGVDLNPLAKQAAEDATPPSMAIRYETSDVFDLGDEPFDIIVSSLFAHHLEPDALVRFVAWMERTAKVGWFINDLHRHPVPYYFLRSLFATLPFNRIVVHDGPVSVARAFTRRDWDGVIEAAGIDPARVEIRWYAPFRWGVGTRPETAVRS